MIHPLTTTQVTEQWDFIRGGLPLGTNPRHILQEALLMNCLLWMSQDRAAIVVTRIEEDRLSGEKSLYVALLVSLNRGLSEGILKDGIRTLFEYAKGRGCTSLTFHSDNKSLLDFAKRLGGRVENFVTIPLGGD